MSHLFKTDEVLWRGALKETKWALPNQFLRSAQSPSSKCHPKSTRVRRWIRIASKKYHCWKPTAKVLQLVDNSSRGGEMTFSRPLSATTRSGKGPFTGSSSSLSGPYKVSEAQAPMLMRMRVQDHGWTLAFKNTPHSFSSRVPKLNPIVASARILVRSSVHISFHVRAIYATQIRTRALNSSPKPIPTNLTARHALGF